MEALDVPDGLNFKALAERIDGGTMSAKKRRAYNILSAMERDGLISGQRSGFYLTRAGADALQALRAGHDVTISGAA